MYFYCNTIVYQNQLHQEVQYYLLRKRCIEFYLEFKQTATFYLAINECLLELIKYE